MLHCLKPAGGDWNSIPWSVSPPLGRYCHVISKKSKKRMSIRPWPQASSSSPPPIDTRN